MKTIKTHIACAHAKDSRHKVVMTFKRGRLVAAHSSGCKKAAEHAEYLIAMARLGRPPEEGSCAALIGLVKQGCEDMLQRHEGDAGHIEDLGPWKGAYVRFETLGVVKETMKRIRRRMRRNRRVA